MTIGAKYGQLSEFSALLSACTGHWVEQISYSFNPLDLQRLFILFGCICIWRRRSQTYAWSLSGNKHRANKPITTHWWKRNNCCNDIIFGNRCIYLALVLLNCTYDTMSIVDKHSETWTMSSHTSSI